MEVCKICDSAVPKIPAPQDPNLTFETQMLCSQPVLYVNHKQLVQKVCIYLSLIHI